MYNFALYEDTNGLISLLIKFFSYCVCNYDESAHFLINLQIYFLVWYEKGEDSDPDPDLNPFDLIISVPGLSGPGSGTLLQSMPRFNRSRRNKNLTGLYQAEVFCPWMEKLVKGLKRYRHLPRK